MTTRILETPAGDVRIVDQETLTYSQESFLDWWNNRLPFDPSPDAFAEYYGAWCAGIESERMKQHKAKELNVEANMAISGEAARLAFKYWQTVEDEEHPYAAQNKGFTPRELGLRRTKAHDALMAQLVKEGWRFKYREDVTVWVEQFVRWIRDE